MKLKANAIASLVLSILCGIWYAYIDDGVRSVCLGGDGCSFEWRFLVLGLLLAAFAIVNVRMILSGDAADNKLAVLVGALQQAVDAGRADNKAADDQARTRQDENLSMTKRIDLTVEEMQKVIERQHEERRWRTDFNEWHVRFFEKCTKHVEQRRRQTQEPGEQKIEQSIRILLKGLARTAARFDALEGKEIYSANFMWFVPTEEPGSEEIVGWSDDREQIGYLNLDLSLTARAKGEVKPDHSTGSLKLAVCRASALPGAPRAFVEEEPRREVTSELLKKCREGKIVDANVSKELSRYFRARNTGSDKHPITKKRLRTVADLVVSWGSTPIKDDADKAVGALNVHSTGSDTLSRGAKDFFDRVEHTFVAEIWRNAKELPGLKDRCV